MTIGQPATRLSKTLASIHHWQGASGLNPREVLRTIDRIVTERMWEDEVGWDGKPMTLLRAVAEPWPVGVGLTPQKLDRLYKLADDAGVDQALVRRVKAAVDADPSTGVTEHCSRGHEFTEENTYRRPDGRRMCRQCQRTRDRKRKATPVERDNITTDRGTGVETEERGTTASYTRSRLARDRPDLHQQVVVGKLTSNAAAIQAGFRKPTATVPIDSVDSAVRALLRRFPSTDIRAALDRAED